MLTEALAYVDAGLSVIPCLSGQKRPAAQLLPPAFDPATGAVRTTSTGHVRHTWKPYQNRLPTHQEVYRWFTDAAADAVAILGGAVSGGLEILDFDAPELLAPWANLVMYIDADLLPRLPLVQSPSGGWHVYYRALHVAGNLKLAVDPEQDKPTLIETRGQGGYVLAPPSPGYTLLRGTLTPVPVVTPSERQTLLAAARHFDQREPDPEPQSHPPQRRPSTAGHRPGDDYNARGNVRALLRQHGWRCVRTDGRQEYWRRPGKQHSWSATLLEEGDGRWFYNFSSNAPGLEPDAAYTPFALYTALEHRGDFSAAAKALKREGYGG
jgi:putative DNA primase/helicase